MIFSERDETYKQILHHGMHHLQELLLRSEWELAALEVEHLHNVPSLIAEPNLERHKYYFYKEKVFYQTMLQTKGGETHKRFVKIFYEPNWKALQSLLAQSQ